MLIRSVLFAVFAGCLSAPGQAQEQTTTVMGTVIDSENQPISDVLVFVDEGPGSATTGAVGAFRLGGVTAGTHLLNLRKAGFAPRTFNLVIAPNEDRRGVGVIMLVSGLNPTATLSGRVTDGPSGRPLLGALVELNGDIVTRTDATGAFGVSDVPIEWGSNEIRVSGISYSALTNEFWMINPSETFDFSVTLDPLPIQLDSIGVAVESRPNVSPRLRPFYERLDLGFGQFVTRTDIEAREPRVVTDMFRGIPGVRLRSTDRGISIVFARTLAMRCTSPAFYLDGIMVGGSEVSINDIVSPDQVEGIELYGGIGSIPMQFSSGAACGVVAIWTR